MTSGAISVEVEHTAAVVQVAGGAVTPQIGALPFGRFSGNESPEIGGYPMRFHNTEIPDDLVSAALSGHLVIFAGAGVSKQKPVCLPSFDELIDQIKGAVDPGNRLRPRRSQESQDKMGVVYTETPEQYLSYLNSETGIVRKECCKILSSGDRANALHRALLRLFPESTPIKIVTTNFDDCFESALADAEEGYETYSSPALPYGNDFSGLVHLHGSIEKPGSMVLLAEDYGKAYVTNGWASRFLVDLFEEYAVLFIGYSCGDSLVDYLTRSISNRITGSAYALCKDDEDSSDWSMRGVAPIPFGEYEDLPLIVGEWADYLEQSITERVRKLREIASYAKLNGDQVEYLLSSFEWSDEDDRAIFAREFCSASTSFDHLQLLCEHGKATFLVCSSPDNTERELLRWTISNFSIEYCADLQELCGPIAGDLSPHFYSELIQHLYFSDAPSKVVGVWIAWLELMPMEYHSQCSYHLLELANMCENPEVAMAIMRMLLRVSFSVSKDYGFGVSKETVVAVNDEYYKDKILQCLDRHKASIGVKVFDYCFEQIEIAYSIQTDSWTNPNVFDSLSYMRASVGPHNQDRYARGAANILLDMAREAVAPEFADDAIRKCLASKCSMLIRLGLWLTNEYRCTGEALRMLQEKGYLSNIFLHHEVFQLMRTSFGVATEAQKDSFADYLKMRLSSNEDSDYECFNICNWILETSRCRKVSQLRDDILSENPSYRPREHPDFTHYMTVGSVDNSIVCRIDCKQFTIEEMVQRISQPSKPGSFIMDHDIVSTPCRDYPEQAFAMIRDLLSKKRTEKESRLCNLLVRSIDWGSSCVTAQDASRLLAAVCSQPDLCIEGINTVDLLTTFADKKMEWGANDLAGILISASKNTDKYLNVEYSISSRDDTDWVQVGMNHPAGKYMQLIATLDRISYKETGGHSETAKKLLSSLSPNSLKESVGAKSLIACYFADFTLWSDMDRHYAQDSASLLSDHSWALAPAWQGIAWHGRLSSLAWELTKSYWKDLFRGPIDVGKRGLDRLTRLYVWVAIVLAEDDKERIQILESCGSGTRQAFEAACHQVDSWLETLDDEGKMDAWSGWISESFRFVGSTTAWGGDVLANMYSRWLRVFPALRPSVAEALARDCACAKEKGLFVREGTLTDIALDGNLAPSDAALTIAFLLEHQRFLTYESDAREAAKCIDYGSLTLSERRRIEDAYTRRGMFDVFEGRSQMQS